MQHNQLFWTIEQYMNKIRILSVHFDRLARIIVRLLRTYCHIMYVKTNQITQIIWKLYKIVKPENNIYSIVQKCHTRNQDKTTCSYKA